MCEAGACWVLEKPIIPAVLYVDVKTLRELMFSPGAAALHVEFHTPDQSITATRSDLSSSPTVRVVAVLGDAPDRRPRDRAAP